METKKGKGQGKGKAVIRRKKRQLILKPKDYSVDSEASTVVYHPEQHSREEHQANETIVGTACPKDIESNASSSESEGEDQPMRDDLPVSKERWSKREVEALMDAINFNRPALKFHFAGTGGGKDVRRQGWRDVAMYVNCEAKTHRTVKQCSDKASDFTQKQKQKVLINYRHVVMKFGLMHVAAANLCTWVYTLVLEAQQSFSSSGHSTKDNNTHHNGSSFTHPSSKDEDMVMISFCYRRRTLYDVASPYLYPFTIEFSLLAAAMFYKMLSNIGHTTVCSAGDEETNQLPETDYSECHKANTGLFLGLAVFVGAGIAMCLFIYLLSQDGMSDITFMIYLISELITNCLTLIAIIPSFYQFSKLHFTGMLEEVFDQNLLIIALGGVYILLGFLGYAGATQVHSSGMMHTFAILQLTVSILKFVSATVQSVFIVDALRRRVKDTYHHDTKPGRSCVTFLLIANLAMWLINTFQLKEVHHAKMFTRVYGKLAWTIIMHIFLPLAIFFRFHSSVSLSDIWQKTYDKHHVHTVHLLNLLPSTKEH